MDTNKITVITAEGSFETDDFILVRYDESGNHHLSYNTDPVSLAIAQAWLSIMLKKSMSNLSDEERAIVLEAHSDAYEHFRLSEGIKKMEGESNE